MIVLVVKVPLYTLLYEGLFLRDFERHVFFSAPYNFDQPYYLI
jgi:hypothetical protein